MKKEIRCFVTNAKYATPWNQTLTPVYEISEKSNTFAKKKIYKAVVADGNESLVTCFHTEDDNMVSSKEARTIVNVIDVFVNSVGPVTSENKSQIISNFLRIYNSNNPDDPITDFNYNVLILYNKKNFPDFVMFEVKDMIVNAWVADESFKLLYPLYDIDVIPPFENFPKIVRNPVQMLTALDEFDFAQFNKDVNEMNGGFPPTYTRFLNIPYRASWTSKRIDCWFGFNVYGDAGDYEHIWRDEVYDYLKDLGLDDEFIEEHFPDLFKTNEFFMVPRWNEYALPFKTGQGSINSQTYLAFGAPFDTPKFVPVYVNDKDKAKSDKYFKENTYNFPYYYNNILMHVVNGKYSNPEIQDFKKYYSDVINVPSTHPDYGRMTMKTQRFLTMLNHMCAIGEAKTQTDLFNSIMKGAKEYKFTIGRRAETTYLTIFYDKHRYYMVPRYEFERIIKGGK